MSRIYTVIPGLVSIETNLKKIHDFPFSQDLNFYPPKKQKFHYKIRVESNIIIPSNFDFVNGYCSIKDSKIYYSRKIFGDYGFKVCYDFKDRVFIFNKAYLINRPSIGGMFTIGRYVAHIIEYDLAKKGIVTLLSAAIEENGSSKLILAPYQNGKTFLVKEALSRGYSYVSENFTAIDPVSGIIYGISPTFSALTKDTNKNLKNLFDEKDIRIVDQSKVSKVFLFKKNNIPNGGKEEILKNYISIFTGYYRKNNFVRTLIYLDLSQSEIDENLQKLEKFLLKKIVIIDDLIKVL